MQTKQAVVQNFIAVNTPMEGVVPHMYQDRRGLVTCGMGNLIEPMQLGAAYPWRREDGKLATRLEYEHEWNVINNATGLDTGGWTAATPLCRLHLNPEDIETLVRVKLESNEAELVKRVPNFADHCADVQLMLHSWAWAVGPGGNYPRMLKLIRSGLYGPATTECDINPKEGTIILRNAMNRQLLLNGDVVRDKDLDPEKLLYLDPEYNHSVVSLQHALSLLGFSLAQDGVIGPKTVDVVKRFQASRKLVVDGVVGPLTWAAIQQALRYR